MEDFTKNYCRGCEHSEKCCPDAVGYYYTEKGTIRKCERYGAWQNKQLLDIRCKKANCETDKTFEDYAGTKSELSLTKLKYVVANSEVFKDKCLYVHGPNGTQKTTMMKVTCKELLKKGYSVKFISMNKLIKVLVNAQGLDKEEAEEAYNDYRDVQTADFLVIDECFDKTKVTLFKSGYQIPFLDTFLRERLEDSKKAIFFISNVPINQIDESGYGASIQDLVLRNVRDGVLPFLDKYSEEANRESIFGGLWS